jgi:hypothetical protein
MAQGSDKPIFGRYAKSEYRVGVLCARVDRTPVNATPLGYRTIFGRYAFRVYPVGVLCAGAALGLHVFSPADGKQCSRRAGDPSRGVLQMSRAVYRQIEVFGALLQREMEWRFARRSLGMVEEVASIVVHVATFAFLRVVSGAEIHDSMPILPFVTSGVFVYWMLRTGLNNVSAAVFLVSRY